MHEYRASVVERRGSDPPLLVFRPPITVGPSTVRDAIGISPRDDNHSPTVALEQSMQTGEAAVYNVNGSTTTPRIQQLGERICALAEAAATGNPDLYTDRLQSFRVSPLRHYLRIDSA